MRSVLIIGAGPAGLTAAYELLRRGEYTVTVLEESDIVGGLSRTVNYKGNRMDIGGHRFFTKVPEVNAWWEDMLPLQGALPLDDRLLEDVLAKSLHRRNRKVETSRIGEFHDPKLGPGRLREITEDEIERMGGRSLKNARVTGLRRENDRIRSLICERDGRRERMEADVFISSMPVRDLVTGMDCTPNEIRDIAAGLPYRDYITVGVLTKGLLLQNRTGIPTLGGIVPDNRICVNDSSVHVGRFQIYNNIDHSMCTAFEAVRAILSGSADKRAIWSVNTEEACHESEKHRA